MVTGHTAFIGFGEAARAFARGTAWSAYDPLPEKQRDAANAGGKAVGANAGAVAGAGLVLSVVTADQLLPAAEETARTIAGGALYCDMNSGAPQTKRRAAEIIEAAGGRYVDVAVMAPVEPQRLAVPLLISGPHAPAAIAALSSFGFTNVRAVGGDVGRASSIKMIRSVMVKGIEALTAEMLLAADAAQVRDEVVASLGGDWATRADYNIERMTTHGIRRAAEMQEVAQTLDALGINPVMTLATIRRQHALGQARTLTDIAA